MAHSIAVPTGTRISMQLAGADFYDAYAVPVQDAGKTALELYLDVVAVTPGWVNFLMAMRNRIVALFGLKNLGRMGSVKTAKDANSYKVGDRVGIFSIFSLSQQEIILGDADKHLTAQVSIYKISVDGQCKVVVTTVVHTNNLLGRVYLFFVVPVHRIIVPAMLTRSFNARRK